MQYGCSHSPTNLSFSFVKTVENNFRIEQFYLIPKLVVHLEGMKSLSDDSELWQQLKHHKI
jgi:hypothetical protein